MNVPLIDLNIINREIYAEIKDKIEEMIFTSAFVSGKQIEKFEAEFAKYLGVRHCLAVSTGTAALELALMSLDIKEGDEVIIPTNSFIAAAEAVSRVGAKPVFAEIEEETYNIDANQVEKLITKRTKVIVPVHLYGQTAAMDKLKELAKKYKISLIEDACQAHGALYKNVKAGALGNLGCFSFYPSKNLGAWGEGGLVSTNNSKLADKIKILRDHGAIQKYHHELIGSNFRLIELQGLVLSAKLKHLDEWNERRRQAAALYNQLLKDSAIVTPKELPERKHVYYVYVIRSKMRDALQKFLTGQGIGTGIHFPIPLHLQKAYQYLNYKLGDFPVAERVTQEILSLPLYPGITAEQVKFVAEKIKEFHSA